MSVRESVLEAVVAALETIPGAEVHRNIEEPVDPPASGVLVIRDGDPGEPERVLGDGPGRGPLIFTHEIPIEVYAGESTAVGGPTPEQSRASLLTAVETALRADPQLGGGCNGFELRIDVLPVFVNEGETKVVGADVILTAEYQQQTEL